MASNEESPCGPASRLKSFLNCNDMVTRYSEFLEKDVDMDKTIQLGEGFQGSPLKVRDVLYACYLSVLSKEYSNLLIYQAGGSLPITELTQSRIQVLLKQMRALALFEAITEELRNFVDKLFSVYAHNRHLGIRAFYEQCVVIGEPFEMPSLVHIPAQYGWNLHDCVSRSCRRWPTTSISSEHVARRNPAPRSLSWMNMRHFGTSLNKHLF